ncbi:hypothetical protein AKJ16_DCAP00290 [Drosera capensis]
MRTDFHQCELIRFARPSRHALLLHQVPHPAFNMQNSAPAGRVGHRSSATFPSHPSHTSQARLPRITPLQGANTNSGVKYVPQPLTFNTLDQLCLCPSAVYPLQFLV